MKSLDECEYLEYFSESKEEVEITLLREKKKTKDKGQKKWNWINKIAEKQKKAFDRHIWTVNEILTRLNY